MTEVWTGDESSVTETAASFSELLGEVVARKGDYVVDGVDVVIIWDVISLGPRPTASGNLPAVTEIVRLHHRYRGRCDGQNRNGELCDD